MLANRKKKGAASRNSATRKRRIALNVSEKAFIKTVGLIDAFDGEVGWHGTVTRSDKYTFNIEDIFVYPQTATAVSIDTEQFEYEKWLMTQNDDIFNRLRMHGHSHVNFGVTPSSKDDRHRSGIAEKLSNDMYYIFMIWNKSLKVHTLIYDCAPKLIYSNNLIDLSATIRGKRQPVNENSLKTVRSLLTTAEINEFIGEAQSKVKNWSNKNNVRCKL